MNVTALPQVDSALVLVFSDGPQWWLSSDCAARARGGRTGAVPEPTELRALLWSPHVVLSPKYMYFTTTSQNRFFSHNPPTKTARGNLGIPTSRRIAKSAILVFDPALHE